MSYGIWHRFQSVAHQDPKRIAFYYGDETLSFAAWAARARGFASQLSAQGFRPGDRCVIWGENTPQTAVAVAGVYGAGGVPTFVNAQSPQHHCEHALTITGARALFAPREQREVAGFDGICLGPEETEQEQENGVAVTQNAKSVASIVFTSGSTGLPKGVAQSQENLIWGADTLGRLLSYSVNDRILGAVPWSFDYGWGQLLATMLVGVPQVLPLSKGGLATCEAIGRHRPTILPGTPSLFSDLLRGVAPIDDVDTSDVRLLTNTGSKLQPVLIEEINAKFPAAQLSLNYGLTETYRSASLPPAEAEMFPGSVGYALPGAALAVVNADGCEVAPRETGEIVHRGAGVFLGYWGDPEKTAAALRPDPLFESSALARPNAVFTGDLGHFDEDGRLYVEGRRDRQLKSMGVRVSPDEVEMLLERSGLVKEVAVLGRAHDVLGQQVVAVISLKEPGRESMRDLKKAARQTMSPFMMPMVWHEMADLPHNANGKVDYQGLKRLLEESNTTAGGAR